jgi:hypothetical protein
MQGRFDEAAVHFTRAVEIEPGHPAATDHLQRIRRAPR